MKIEVEISETDYNNLLHRANLILSKSDSSIRSMFSAEQLLEIPLKSSAFRLISKYLDSISLVLGLTLEK